MNFRLRRGFTIVELIVVVTVIAILAGIAIVSYGQWRNSIAKNEVQSDLNGVQAVMESNRSFNNGYPVQLPASFVPSKNVDLTYVTGDDKQYCIEAKSSVVESVVYNLKTEAGKSVIGAGQCAISLSVPVLTVTGKTTSSVALSWSPVANATQYRLQYDESANFNVNPGTITMTTTSRTVSSIKSNTTYYFRMKAISSRGESDWSATASAYTGNTYAISVNNGNQSFINCSSSCSGYLEVRPRQAAPYVSLLKNGEQTVFDIMSGCNEGVRCSDVTITVSSNNTGVELYSSAGSSDFRTSTGGADVWTSLLRTPVYTQNSGYNVSKGGIAMRVAGNATAQTIVVRVDITAAANTAFNGQGATITFTRQ